MSSLSLNLLGSFGAYLDGESIDELRSSRVQALLIYLAVERSTKHRREYLFTLLWPGMPEKSARHNLSQTIYALRQTFPAVYSDGSQETVPLILANRQTIQLNPEASVDTDIHQLDSLLEETQTHEHLNLIGCKTCIQALEQAVGLYRGDFLADFYLEDSNQFEDWATATREAYRRKTLEALQTLTDIAIQKNAYDQASAYAERQLAIDNLNENAHRQMMEVLALAGRRVEALRQYRQCVRILEDELGVAPSSETTALYDRIQAEGLPSTLSEQIEPKPEEPSIPFHNLPSQPTPFIGRETDLAALDKLITDPEIQLVTIVGPGGMGKTRLAIACAERQLRAMVDSEDSDRGGSQTNPSIHPHRDGVFFVDLTPLREADHIVLAVADALDIQLGGGGGGPGAPRKHLLDYLGDKGMLFILDNFEHLLAGADLVSDILQAAPGVQILATSRERLHLRQEQLYPIPGLSFPDWEVPEDAAEYTAVRLFLSAARRIRPDFELSAGDLTDLTRICRLVGGMPLALELAAGWTELLPLVEIASEIERSLGFLETELRDVPDRHRSMRAIFDTTWERLEPAERDMMRVLSVFRGGFTRDAASQVAADQDGASASLRLLVRLVSKSLLQVNPSQERYQVHDLLRQYAQERLEISGELDDTRTAHSSYFIEMLSQREADIKGGRGQKGAMDEIEADFANIRVAWDWALNQNNLEAIDRSLEALFWFCRFRNREFEGVELYLQAEAQLAPGSEREANPLWRCLAARRIFLDQWAWVGDYRKKLREIKLILAVARAEGEQTEVAFALSTLGLLQMELSYSTSLRSLEESRLIYHTLGDNFSESWILDRISFVHLNFGQLEKRVEIARQRLEMARKRGDRLTTADALGQIGIVAEMTGNYTEAEVNYTEVLLVFRELGDRFHTAEYNYRLGWLAFMKGELGHARALVAEGQALVRKFNLRAHLLSYGMLGMILNAEEQYSQAAQRYQDIPSDWALLFVFLRFRGMAYAMCGLGDFAAAKNHLSKAVESAIFYKAPGWQVQCLPAAALIDAADGNLERAAELLALAFHHPASATGWLGVFPLITRLRTRLEDELPTEVYAEAWERGMALDLDETLATLLPEDLDESSASD